MNCYCSCRLRRRNLFEARKEANRPHFHYVLIRFIYRNRMRNVNYLVFSLSSLIGLDDVRAKKARNGGKGGTTLKDQPEPPRTRHPGGVVCPRRSFRFTSARTKAPQSSAPAANLKTRLQSSAPSPRIRRLDTLIESPLDR